MNNPLFQLIDFPSFESDKGILSVIHANNTDSSHKLPFEIKRVFFMNGMKVGDKRGGHTHHKTNQILFPISGSCKIDLDNSKEKTTVDINTHNKGIILFPYTWHVMHSFTPNTTLLVLADTEYDSEDYIHTYDEFLSHLK
jgi:hypothetical protein